MAIDAVNRWHNKSDASLGMACYYVKAQLVYCGCSWSIADSTCGPLRQDIQPGSHSLQQNNLPTRSVNVIMHVVILVKLYACM